MLNKSMKKVLVKDIMNKKVIVGKENETVATIFKRMEKRDIKEMPIVDNKMRYKGLVTMYDILTHAKENLQNMKIKEIMFSCPTVSKNDKVIDIIKTMTSSGVEALPVVEDNVVIGIVSDYDILKEFKNHPKFKKIKSIEVARKGIPSAKKDYSVQKVRRIMMLNNVDRLPVVNEEGKCEGLILLIDILRYVISKPLKGKPKLRPIKLPDVYSLPISHLIRKVEGVKPEQNLSLTIDYMLKNKLRGIHVEDNKIPLGIIIRKDLLNLIKKKGEEVKVKFVGISESEEIINTSLIEPIIKRAYMLTQGFLKEVEIIVKRIRSDVRPKYEISINLRQFKISVKSVGHSISEALYKGLSKLIKLLEKRQSFFKRVKRTKEE